MKTKNVLRLLIGSCAWGVLASAAMAQDAPRTVVLEEIVLTGENIARTLSETASSATAISGNEIESRQADDTVEKAIVDVPNLTFAGTVGAPMIRGQDTQGPNSGAGAFFGGTTPRASINVDGRYLSYNEFAFGAASVWDAAGIEVYRGPQTTSQGANSIAGAIIVHTKDPTFEREGVYQLQAGSDNRRRASFAYSAPLSDELAARVALDYSARDTFIDYTNPKFAKGASDQDFESRTARVKLLWRPSQLSGFEAKLTYQHDQSNRPTSESAFEPFKDLNSLAATMPSWKQRSNSFVLDTSYDTGGLKLVNQLQYSDVVSHRVIEPMASGAADIDLRSVSNETRAVFGDTEGPGVSGVAGLYLSRKSQDEMLLLRGNSAFTDQKDNIGIFTELTWRTDSPWSVTGGLRYQRNRIQRSGTSSFAKGGPLSYDKTFDAWLPKLSVAYAVDDKTTVGAMVSRGYNPGGVSLNFQSGEYVPYEAEKVWNYELFGRTALMDDRLMLTGNLFYSNFTNAQRYVQVSLPENVGQSLTVNAEKAKSYGLEVGMDWQARDDLRLRGGLGLLHTEISEFRNALANFEGKEFSRAPKHSFSLGADWDITPQIRLSGDVRYSAGYFSDDENTAAYEIDSYTVANARMTYTADNGMEVYGYVNNMFDQRAPLYKMINRSVGAVEATMLQPREVGIGLTHRF